MLSTPCESDIVETPLHWYAVKVFYRRHDAIKATLARDNVRYFIPMKWVKAFRDRHMTLVEKPLDAMLMFVQSSEEYINELDKVLCEKGMVYHYPGTREPAVIADEEMRMFILVTSARDEGLKVLTEWQSTRHRTRFRVIGGALKGAEGVALSGHSKRRLVISVGDIISVVTSPLAVEMLEQIQ